jgi:hypothetical protein
MDFFFLFFFFFFFFFFFYLYPCCSHMEYKASVICCLLDEGSARRKAAAYTGQHQYRLNGDNIHTLSGIRTHDPSVRAGEHISCLRPRGHCNRHDMDNSGSIPDMGMIIFFASTSRSVLGPPSSLSYVYRGLSNMPSVKLTTRE